jgi:hypothetical protein
MHVDVVPLIEYQDQSIAYFIKIYVTCVLHQELQIHRTVVVINVTVITVHNQNFMESIVNFIHVPYVHIIVFSNSPSRYHLPNTIIIVEVLTSIYAKNIRNLVFAGQMDVQNQTVGYKEMQESMICFWLTK